MEYSDAYRGRLILTERQTEAGGRLLLYRLIAVQRDAEVLYQIAVKDGETEECADVGYDLTSALGLLERIARGCVFPGNVSELLEDDRYEKRIIN